MSAKHRARSWMRLGTVVAMVGGAVAASLLATAGSSGAATSGNACESRSLGIDSDRTFSVNQSNGQTDPCATDSNTVASATAVLGLAGLAANATGLSSYTIDRNGTAGASDTVASLLLHGVGLTIKITAIQAQAFADCGGHTGSASTVGTVIVNGKHYVIGSAPATIKLPLGLLLNFNKQTVSGNEVTQWAVSLTSIYNNFRHTVVGEAVAGASCEEG